MNQKVYADNAATTPLDEKVIEAMMPYLKQEYGNASQPYSFARAAKQALNQARETIASCINAKPSEIFFTSGGSESDNWAIKGTFFAKQGDIITSAIEHHAVINTVEYLKKFGCKTYYLPVDKKGTVQINELEKHITKRTRLVSVMTANNEIGTIQPIKELAQTAYDHNVLFHTDAVQAVGHINIDVQNLGVDMLSASAHKFNGPKGIGFLFKRSGIHTDNLIHGGMQENGNRAGTENIALIVGMAKALEDNVNELSKTQKLLQSLDDDFMRKLSNSGLHFVRNGNRSNGLYGNISISFYGADGEALLHRLDLKGVSVSTGAACDSSNTQISHVLNAIGLDKKYALGTIRISLGKYNTVEDIDYIVNALVNIINK